MKTGTQQLVYKVENILYENHVKNGRRRIAHEIVDEIMRLIGDEMKNDWNLAHAFPKELEPIVRKMEKEFGINMMRDEEAIEVYRWITEQEKEGKPLARFIEWATSDEQIRYVAKYRLNPGLIRNDYRIAFGDAEKKYNPQNLEVGF